MDLAVEQSWHYNTITQRWGIVCFGGQVALMEVSISCFFHRQLVVCLSSFLSGSIWNDGYIWPSVRFDLALCGRLPLFLFYFAETLGIYLNVLMGTYLAMLVYQSTKVANSK